MRWIDIPALKLMAARFTAKTSLLLTPAKFGNRIFGGLILCGLSIADLLSNITELPTRALATSTLLKTMIFLSFDNIFPQEIERRSCVITDVGSELEK